MNDPKIIEVSTNLITNDPNIFFDWFENKFIVGRHFIFGDRFFLLTNGALLPWRAHNTFTLTTGSDGSEVKITAIKSPHGGIDVKAVCKTPSQEFESFFGDVWDEITTKQSASIEEPVVEKAVEKWLPWLHIPDEKEYRQIIELWCKGKTAKEIAKDIFMKETTIHNIISDLRKSYPKARIPKDRARRSMRF